MNLDNKKVFNKVGGSIAIMTIIVYLVQIILSKLFSNYVPAIADSKWIAFILLGISFYLIGFPLCAYLLKSLPDREKRQIKKLSIKRILILFLISFFVMFIVNIATIGLLSMISYAKGSTPINPLQKVVADSNLFGTFLFIGIFSPIIEEILFRGFLLNKLSCYGDKIAIITTALLFGLFHGNLSQFFYAVALGMVFAYVTLKTGTIKYSIILHIMINMMGSVISIFALTNTTLTTIYGTCIIIFVILGLILFIKNIKKITLSAGSIQIPRGQIFKTTCLNFGMIFNFLINVGLMIYVLLL